MSMTPEEFWSILHDAPEPEPVFYRVYYNDDGTVICYSMEDLPGKYIDIDQPTYARSYPNVRVINGKLVETVPATVTRKLTPNGTGTSCDPWSICVIIDKEPNIKWSVSTYESN